MGSLYCLSLITVITTANSLAVNCTSIFKDGFLTFTSVLLFSDINVSRQFLAGLSLSFVGGVAVMAIKHQETHKANPK